MNKTYQATVTKSVMMTKEEYSQHLTSQKAMYQRLIDDRMEAKAKAIQRIDKAIASYQTNIDLLNSEIQDLT